MLSTVPATAEDVLLRREPNFNRLIRTAYMDSTPDKIPITGAPLGLPDMLLILEAIAADVLEFKHDSFR